MSKTLSAVGVIAGAVAIGISAFSLSTSLDVKKSLAELVASQKATAGYHLESEEHFQEAVVSALNKMVKERQEQNIQAKYDTYKLAPEEVPGGKKIYGNLNARFTLVEYSETECPFCLKHQPTMKNLVDQSKGNINWQWKHLPLSFHNPAAIQQAIVGECVAEQQGNRAFWVYIDEVFKKSAGGGKGVADLSLLVEEMGVDMGELRKCIGSNKMRDVVEADMEQAAQFNISGTPATFVVDNQTGKTHLISGAQPAGAFMATIRRMMDESNESEAQEQDSDA